MLSHSKITSHRQLDTIAESIIHMLSAIIDTNSMFIARNDLRYNYIIKSLNRNDVIVTEGDVYPFEQMLCSLLVDRKEKPLVVPNLVEHPLTRDHFVTRYLGGGSFLGCAIYLDDGEMFGTLCVWGTKPYSFSDAQVEAVQRMAALFCQSVMLKEQAIKDSLTGLYNRNFIFGDELHSKVHCTSHSVICINLNRFSVINEAVGYEHGDQVLLEVTRRITNEVPNTCIVASMGGDEWVILQPVSSDMDVKAEQLAQRILQCMSDSPITIGEHDFHLTASAGVSVYPTDGEDINLVVRKAEIAMLASKQSGGDQVGIYEEQLTSAKSRFFHLETSLRKALQKDELHLVYQPQFHLETGELVGFEALLRWVHPVYGVISPAEFIPIAEESGLIRDIGQWVLHTACRQGKLWQEQGFPPVYVSVNVSPVQFEDYAFIGKVRQALDQTGFAAACLKVELTESQLITNVPYTLDVLKQLKELGVHISVDDFGTGYSSLSYLAQYPIDCLKLDRQFSMNLHEEKNRVIAKTVITLAHSLGLSAVAEGIETDEQLQFLREQGCNWGQGYYLGKPLQLQEAEQLYERLLLA